jgi:hypothetical protein
MAVSGQLCFRENSPPVPTEQNVPLSRFGRFGAETDLLLLPGMEPQFVASTGRTRYSDYIVDWKTELHYKKGY